MLGTEVPRRQLLNFVLQPLVGRSLAHDSGQFLGLAVNALSFAFCQTAAMSEKWLN